MRAIQQPHPSAEDVSAFALGQLDGEALAAVEGHLAGCPACQARAAATADDRLIRLIRSSRIRVEPPPGGETLTEAVLQTVPPQPLTPMETATFPLGPSSDADAATAEDDLPEELARHERYRVTRLLGKGGMGAVYEAEHRFMQRPVALKVINRAYTARPASVERFRREVRAAARLSHPNIVTAYDAENAGQTHFLVMEYIAGTTLAQLVQERGPLPVAEACDYIRQVALGLQHAHEHGMVHRDIKPDNLILASGGRVKVLDFGLAALVADREAGAGLTEADVVMGTPEYMAPEQADDARAAHTRADVYSLGCSLYFLLTGAAPYPAATPILKLLAHRDRPVPSVQAVRPEVPEELSGIVARMLAKKPANRYQTPGEVAAALEAFVAGRRKPPATPKHLALAALLFAALALVAAAAAVYRIATDTGELVITTESDDVEVVVKQGGKVVRVIDVKTDKQVVLTLRSGSYELELPGAHAGLRLTLEKAMLRRGEKELAKIERVAKPAQDAVREPEGKPGDIRVVYRVSLPQNRMVYQTAVAPDGRYFAADVGEQGFMNVTVVVWDGRTGRELRRLPGYLSSFTTDGKRIVTAVGHTLRIAEVDTGLQLRAVVCGAPMWRFRVLPDGRHAVAFTVEQKLHLADLEAGKVVKTWPAEEAFFAATADGRFLLVRPAGQKSHVVWDLAHNKPSRELAAVARYARVYGFQSGDREAIVGDDTGLNNKLVAVADGKHLATVFDRFPGPVAAARGAADFQTAMQAFGDGTLRLFELVTQKELATWRLLDGERPVRDGTIYRSYDGRFACLASDRSVYLLRLPDAPPPKE